MTKESECCKAPVRDIGYSKAETEKGVVVVRQYVCSRCGQPCDLYGKEGPDDICVIKKGERAQ